MKIKECLNKIKSNKNEIKKNKKNFRLAQALGCEQQCKQPIL